MAQSVSWEVKRSSSSQRLISFPRSCEIFRYEEDKIYWLSRHTILINYTKKLYPAYFYQSLLCVNKIIEELQWGIRRNGSNTDHVLCTRKIREKWEGGGAGNHQFKLKEILNYVTVMRLQHHWIWYPHEVSYRN